MAIIPIQLVMNIPASQFYPSGEKVYVDKVNEHFIWDTVPEKCNPDCS